MFNINKKLIILFLILSLCAALWVQYQMISSLKAEIATQAQTIQSQQEANQKLSNQLKEERQAIEKQQQITNQIKKDAESKREKVRIIFKDNKCANTHLSDDIIKQLQ